MAEAVYLLCGATSFVCAFLLLKGFRRTGVRLLFWSGLCFAGLTINNLLLFLDLIVVPEVDISIARNGTALISIALLLGGLIWESR